MPGEGEEAAATVRLLAAAVAVRRWRRCLRRYYLGRRLD